jgi:hypothetical protein
LELALKIKGVQLDGISFPKLSFILVGMPASLFLAWQTYLIHLFLQVLYLDIIAKAGCLHILTFGPHLTGVLFFLLFLL